MTGTTFNEPLLPKEAKQKRNRLQTLRLICCLLLSNTLTYLLAAPDKPQPRQPPPREGHTRVRWKLDNRTAGEGITRATLLAGNKVVAPQVYLHNSPRQQAKGQYTLEIPVSQLPRLLRHRGTTLSALPHAPYGKPAKAKKKEEPYEIRL